MEGACGLGSDCLSREPFLARPTRANAGNIPAVHQRRQALLRDRVTPHAGGQDCCDKRDVVVYLRGQKIVFTGDIIATQSPDPLIHLEKKRLRDTEAKRAKIKELVAWSGRGTGRTSGTWPSAEDGSEVAADVIYSVPKGYIGAR